MQKNAAKICFRYLGLCLFVGTIAVTFASCGSAKQLSLQQYWSEANGHGVTLDLRDPYHLFSQHIPPDQDLTGHWQFGARSTIEFDYDATKTDVSKHRVAAYSLSANNQVLTLTFEDGEKLELTYGP